MAPNKNATTLAAVAKIESRSKSSGNDADAQRRRVLDFLRQHGSLSTIDARHLIDCLHPAARVMELRNAGYSIATVWSHEVTPEGGKHRVARYHLMSGASAC